ncbi:MAG: hypothetical protein WBA18_00485, partial [Terracidiphilus sp.]
PPVPILISFAPKQKTHRAIRRVGWGTELDSESIPRHTSAVHSSSSDTLRDGMRGSSNPVAEDFSGGLLETSRNHSGKHNVRPSR